MYTISSVFKHDHLIDSQIDLLMLIQVLQVLITHTQEESHTLRN
jgi:hypothetical protein